MWRGIGSASFLGSKALERHANTVITSLALVSLLLVLILGILVLAPRKELAFSLSGPLLHAGLALTLDRADQHQRLSGWLDGLWQRNEPSLWSLHLRFRLMARALAIQIVLWTLALGATVGVTS